MSQLYIHPADGQFLQLRLSTHYSESHKEFGKHPVEFDIYHGRKVFQHQQEGVPRSAIRSALEFLEHLSSESVADPLQQIA